MKAPEQNNSRLAEQEVIDPTAFEQYEAPEHRKRLAQVGTGVLAVGAAFAAYKFGMYDDILDPTLVVQPGARPEIIDGLIGTNEALRTAAPVVAAAAIVRGAQYKLASKMSSRSAMLDTLSKTEYSGTDNLTDSPSDQSLIPRIKRKLTKGAGLATFAVILTGATSGVEHEISNGPQRPIDAMYEVITPGAESRATILQDRNVTFMDDSEIEKGKMDEFVDYAKEKDVTVVPFKKKLFNIEGQSALQVSIPDEQYKAITKQSGDLSCENPTIIVDDTIDKNVGEKVSVNGYQLTVAAKHEGMAQMNRSIGVLSEKVMRECVQKNTDSSYFGAIIPNKSPEEINKLMKESGVFDAILGSVDQREFQEAMAGSSDHFDEANRKFWQKNGTAILLQLIGYIGAFSMVAISSQRRSELQRNVREIGILNASGVSMKTLREVEQRRALRQTFKATAMGAPFVPVVGAVFNSAQTGLKVGVGIREIAVGTTVAWAASAFGGRLAIRKFSKDLNTSQAVKG